MARRTGPTLRSQWLGQQLRELRDRRGLTLKQVGELLQRDGSMISRFESAEYPIRNADVVLLLDLYDVSEQRQRDGLLQLCEDAWQKGWWEGYADTVDRQFIDYPWLEERADRICSYNALVLPGLVQTPEYAEALMRNAVGRYAPAKKISRGMELRLKRQEVLEGDAPTRMSAVLDEAALRRTIGGPDIMHAQLMRLVDLMQRPNIDLRVIPFEAGAHGGLDGSFTLFEVPEPYPDVAYVESLAGPLYVESPGVENFQRAYDQLYEAAFGPGDSAELVSAIAEAQREPSEAPG